VDPDDRFEKPEIGEIARRSLEGADRECPGEGGPDLRFVGRQHPAQDPRHVTPFEGGPRVADDGALERVAVGEGRYRQDQQAGASQYQTRQGMSLRKCRHVAPPSNPVEKGDAGSVPRMTIRAG